MTDGDLQIGLVDAPADTERLIHAAPARPLEAAMAQPERAPQTQRPPIEPLTREELKGAIDAFAEVISALNRGVRFEVDEAAGRLVAQVVDRETDEVLRQIPPEEFLELASRLRDFAGLLLDIEI